MNSNYTAWRSLMSSCSDGFAARTFQNMAPWIIDMRAVVKKTFTQRRQVDGKVNTIAFLKHVGKIELVQQFSCNCQCNVVVATLSKVDYIQRAAICKRTLARLFFGGRCPGGPGSESISWRLLNVSERCSALWLDSKRASPVKSSSVTRSTAITTCYSHFT